MTTQHCVKHGPAWAVQFFGTALLLLLCSTFTLSADGNPDDSALAERLVSELDNLQRQLAQVLEDAGTADSSDYAPADSSPLPDNGHWLESQLAPPLKDAQQRSGQGQKDLSKGKTDKARDRFRDARQAMAVFRQNLADAVAVGELPPATALPLQQQAETVIALLAQ